MATSSNDTGNLTNLTEDSLERIPKSPLPRLQFGCCSHPNMLWFCSLIKEFSTPGGRGRGNGHEILKNGAESPFICAGHNYSVGWAWGKLYHLLPISGEGICQAGVGLDLPQAGKPTSRDKDLKSQCKMTF